MTTDEYINNLEKPLSTIVIKLRKSIQDVSPDITEAIKWSVPVYSLNKNICSIIAHKRHVNLQIFNGAHLRSANKMQGTGKDMRHIKFVSEAEIKPAEIRKILKEAIAADA